MVYIRQNVINNYCIVLYKILYNHLNIKYLNKNCLNSYSLL